MKIHKLTTVLFDLDGTLLDTAPDLLCALNTTLSEEGVRTLTMPEIRGVISQGTRHLIRIGFNISMEHPDYPRLRAAFLSHYEKKLCHDTKLFHGMDMVLNKLDELGMPWGVVTSKETRFATAIMEQAKLIDRCHCIVGYNCIAKPKPDPEPLLLACERLKSNPIECVYLGDAENDIIASKAAGMRAIAALYGYLGKDEDPEKWLADYYIDQPKDFLPWLDTQRRCSAD